MGFPSPSHAAASLDRGRGSGQKGKCEEFPSACNQSPQALGVVDPQPAPAMEPLETPIKDGILYQQHVKFGKVGTLAARQLLRTNSGPPPQTGTAHPGLGEWTWESGWGIQPRGLGWAETCAQPEQVG